MKVFRDERTRAHAGDVELTGGRFVPCFESPAREEALVTAVAAAGHEIVPATESGLEPILAVHDRRLVAFLETAYERWCAEIGEARDALPIAWPSGTGMRRVEPATMLGRLGYWCFDASTPITAGTWTSARASVDVALAALAAVTGGERVAFAACRPPGHHAGSDFYGGYCFLNATAIAAQAAVDAGAGRVAVLDVDDHHGNGTQEIFARRPDVLTLSLHGDPDGAYPYFSGRVDEIGEGPGEGANVNYPLARGCGWTGFDAALSDALARVAAFGPDLLVVPLGVDTSADDPIGARVGLAADDFAKLGARLASARRPTLIVMEGGYAIPALGAHVAAVLDGFEGR